VFFFFLMRNEASLAPNFISYLDVIMVSRKSETGCSHAFVNKRNIDPMILFSCTHAASELPVMLDLVIASKIDFRTLDESFPA